MHTMKYYAAVAVYGIISLHFADRRLTAATQYGLRRCRDLGTPRGYLGALRVPNLSLDVVNGVRRLDVFAMAGPPRREAASAPVMPRGARPAEPAQVERDYLPPVDALAILADLELLAR